MRKRQGGQAFILVLILLAIGALLIVPVLRFSSTSLRNNQIVTRQVKAIYAANAAQEWILWKLSYTDLGSEFTEDGQEANYEFDACGIPVEVTIIMRALPGTGGITLATDDVIKPTKTVNTGFTPNNWVPDKNLYDYTYTINLEQLSTDNSQGLDAIYDLPPGRITDYIGPSEVFIDGEWHQVPDPEWDPAKGYLKWPADYDHVTETGAFSSDPLDENHYFHGIRDFEVREDKKLRFKVRGRLDNNQVHCNWVVLKPWNTVSGPQAPIDVGSPDNPGLCEDHSVLEVTKESYPEVIQPGVLQQITYTISITNMYTQTRHIQEIIDYLPPGFEYLNLISSEMENPSEAIEILELDPDDITLRNINGIDRLELLWTTEKFPNQNAISIASGQTLKLTFLAETTKNVSGSYYNEIVVILTETGLPPGFGDIGVSPAEYGSNYSWNTGSVLVPFYDSRVDAGQVIIDSNIGMILGGVAVNSWQVR